MKIERTKRIIEETLGLGAGRASCVFFSGGVDSLLVLYFLKSYKIPVITFSTDWTPGQRKALQTLVADWDLTLYDYPPLARYVVPAGSGLTLVDEYGFGGIPLPVLRDVEEGERCLADLAGKRFENFDFGFDTCFVGALASDEHPAIGETWFEERKPLGPLEFVAPLFDWTKEEVEEEAKRLGIDSRVIEKTGEIELCTRCLRGDAFCPAEQKQIPKIDWNEEEALTRFREKFGFA